MRVLGIDTSLRQTGYGVVEAEGTRLKSIEYGDIPIPASQPHSVCLTRIDEALRDVIARTRPDAASIEGIFFCRSVRTAIVLGEARGVAITACARAGIPVFEYEPRRMKLALVGFGGAQKSQVAKMVVRLLGLKEEPQEDAADALGLAICHIQSRSSIAALNTKPI